MNRPNLRLLAAASLLLLPAALGAQTTVTKPADPGHAAGGLQRALFGSGYRDAWVVPVTAPVLDLNTFAGGLTPFREGGNQSRTLRFRAGNGKIYQFRSTQKFLPRAMPEDLQDTPAGDVIQDQSSAMHPTGHLVVSGLQERTSILHPLPTLVVLPDDPRLGEYRKTFAGMMGQLEERPEDYDDEKLNFGGADKIIDADKLIENLEESLEHYLDPSDYLRARLMDMLVGDTDRGADQWQFARYDEGGRKTYRSIPRDRDYAFMHSEGLLIRLVSIAYPKLVLFNEKFAALRSYTFMTREFDRVHLSELDWAAWDRVIGELETNLTDAAIRDAVARMPAPHTQLSGPRLASSLISRRGKLREYARSYYTMISEDADIFGSDEDERADIERHADGSVSVRLYRKDAQRPAWERRFVPSDTDEIRVYLERGNDRAVVRGQSDNSIDVRVIGGEGDDVLIDSSHVSQGHTYASFYDAFGNNTIVEGPNTRVSRKPFVTQQPPALEEDEDEKDDKKPARVAMEERRGRYQDLMNAAEGFVEQKTSAETATRSWGEKKGFMPVVELREGTGLILGVGHSTTDFGFRRVPYESRVALGVMVSPTTGRLGAQLLADRHPENSRFGYSLLVRGSQYESNRFFGYGNESVFDTDFVEGSLVRRDEVMVYPSLNYMLGQRSFLSLGPIFKRNTPHVMEGSRPQFFGVETETVSQMGVRLEGVLNGNAPGAMPRSGLSLRFGASSYPGVQDIPEAFHEAHVVAASYLSLGGSVLALRAGGKHIWGDAFPLHEAAFLGGAESLRGYRWNRFAGDASAFGGAELRVPLTRLTLFTRGNFGVLGLADAGRVWYQNESEGGWHAGYGGGVWFETLGQVASLSYAKGEDEGRFYIKLGAPF